MIERREEAALAVWRQVERILQRRNQAERDAPFLRLVEDLLWRATTHRFLEDGLQLPSQTHAL